VQSDVVPAIGLQNEPIMDLVVQIEETEPAVLQSEPETVPLGVRRHTESDAKKTRSNVIFLVLYNQNQAKVSRGKRNRAVRSDVSRLV
jgi:hypothetical protein